MISTTETEKARVIFPGALPFELEDVEEGSLVSRFERQVERDPEQIALRAGTVHWTYRTLNEVANAVAQRILALKLAPGCSVALLLGHRPQAVAAILGALKAGRRFVPLDPAWPSGRLLYMLKDSQPGVLITDDASFDALRTATPSLPILKLDQVDEGVKDNPDLTIAPETDSYIIYTSGSSGQPKGVVHTHRSILHNLWRYTQHLELAPSDNFTLLHSFSFSSGLMDLFWALLNGGTLCMYDIKAQGFEGLGDWLEREEITVLNWGPTLLGHACETFKETHRFPRLRLIVLGSEALSKRMAGIIRKQFPRECVLVNRLGTSETGNYRLFFLKHETPLTGSTVPGGYAIEDKEVLLLGESGEVVGLNEPGEIVIRSRYLASGYWHKPELTARAFSDDPAGGGIRQYRTGDLGMMREGACLEYLGRKDNQIKVRGQRVETGEIEQTLIEAANLKDAVVQARPNQAGEPELVAYLVRGQQALPTVARMREFLSAQLPDHMVPRRWVALDALPLTPSGKVNRQALPAPEGIELKETAEYEAPRSELEKTLAAIWRELLGQERIGIHDNFFALGGHSLLAMRAVARTNDALGIQIAVPRLFESPNIADLAAAIVRSSSGTSAPLKTPAPELGPGAKGEAREERRVYPLSFAQERLWLIEQIASSGTYNEPQAWRLQGKLDVNALERSVNHLVARHEILRTRFAEGDGHPVQVVAPALEIKLARVDLRSRPEGERRSEARRIANEAINTPFDLAKLPLFRGGIVQMGEDDHVFFLAFHHIITDGWSNDIVVQELSALYEDCANGRAPSLPPLAIQYGQHAVEERKRLSGPVMVDQQVFWKKELRDAPLLLDLPTDHPRTSVQTRKAAVHPFSISAELTRDLKAFCRAEGFTPFMVLMATLHALLSRYARQKDVIVGFPTAGRQPEVEGLIGFFINTLLLRTQSSEKTTFLGLMEQVRDRAFEVSAHQDLPFEKLIEAMLEERSLDRSGAFQTMLAFVNAPTKLPSFGETTVEVWAVEKETAKFDITLFARGEGAEMTGRWEYNADLFGPETIARFNGHFRIFLHAALASPHRPLWELPLLTAREQQQILVEWNKTELDHPRHQSLHELFEAQVERTPQAPALVFGTERLSYLELNERANQLAHHLKSIGVGPEVLVAISITRSIEMVVALLAVLKAGGAYVPLDPNYPKERSAFILQDAGVTILLTQERFAAAFSPAQVKVICLDTLELQSHSRSNPEASAKPDNLAYVIFTSGSTGRPKGVAIEHRSTVAFAYWARSVFTPEELAGVLFATSICFDLSVFELFVTLAFGGKVILAENVLQLSSLPAVAEVTLANTVPSAVAELVQSGPLPPGLQVVNLAGEPLPGHLVDKIYDNPGIRKVYDLYGPSEDTTYSTFTLRTRGGRVTIGRPIANTQAYILDDHGQPTPIGVPGELCLAGDGLARGYLNRPDLTAEKFIPNPFSTKVGARLYRTGDQARYLGDGNIEYLGRLDNQVKIRGFRIELGEIESALSGHPEILHAVVLARNDTAGSKELAGYIVPKRGAVLSPQTLRQYLGEKLPDFMVPTQWHLMDKLPVTTSGKVDRKALCELKPPSFGGAAAERHLLTQLQLQIVEVWEELLRVKSIGIHDNFFDVGGHSLLATRMLNRLEQKRGKKVPLRVFFSKPTVEHLAQEFEEGAARPPTPRAVPTRSDKPPFFLLGGGLAILREMQDSMAPTGQALHFLPLEDYSYATEVPGVAKLAAEALERLREMEPKGPYALVSHCFGGLIAYEMALQLIRQGEQVPLIVLIASEPSDRAVKGRIQFLTNGFGTVLRWNDVKKVEAYHRWVAHYLNAANRAGRARRWLGLSVGEKLSSLRRVWDRNKSRQARTASRTVQPLSGNFVVTDGKEIEVWRGENYYWMIAGYKMRAYPGKTVVLAPQEDLEKPAELEARWRRWTKELIVETTPGNHVSCIAEYARPLAAMIQKHLNAL